ncbi:hypothetical protein EC968_000546 [Mortierella alpina]|nr:hypothetical protein EC968_000546 [Mortierella alpina]
MATFGIAQAVFVNNQEPLMIGPSAQQRRDVTNLEQELTRALSAIGYACIRFRASKSTATNRTRVVVVPWVEDPGTKTLSGNVFLTVEGIKESVDRYHLLHDLDQEPVLEKP